MLDVLAFVEAQPLSYLDELEDCEEFISKLLKSQQPLGKKFEEVLFNNLWDLYES